MFYTGKGRNYLGQREGEVNKLNGQKGFRERVWFGIDARTLEPLDKVIKLDNLK